MQVALTQKKGVLLRAKHFLENEEQLNYNKTVKYSNEDRLLDTMLYKSFKTISQTTKIPTANMLMME